MRFDTSFARGSRTMKPKGCLRVAALGCILASLPIAFLTFPWLPATVMEFRELQHDPAPWGTASYHADRAQRRERVRLALVLYALGTISLCGLYAIVASILPWWVQTVIWIITFLTALQITRFETPTMP